jgi:hypothetical protein
MIQRIVKTAEKAVEASVRGSLKVVEHLVGTKEEPPIEEPQPDDQPDIPDDQQHGGGSGQNP